jgi:hypothetical protein
MKEMASWRGARVASLIPNILPKAQAAACVLPTGSCWCSAACSWCASCRGNLYCINCNGRVVYHGSCSACV